MGRNQRIVEKKLGKFAESVYQHRTPAAAQPPQTQLQQHSMSGRQPQLLLLHNPMVDNFLGPPGLAEAIRNPPGTLPRKACAIGAIPPWLAKEVLRAKNEDEACNAASGSKANKCKGKDKANDKSRPGLAKASRTTSGRTFSKACAIGAIPSWLAKDVLVTKGVEKACVITVDGNATIGKGNGKSKDESKFLCQRLMRGQVCAFGNQCWHSHDVTLQAMVEKAHKDWRDSAR